VSGDEEVTWTEVHNDGFPGKDDKAEGELIKDYVATVDVPEEVRE